jgi:hypothetical protein
MANLSKQYPMSIWGLIGHSYALPLQKFGSLVKVFWLPALVWGIFAIGSEYAHRHIIEPGTFTFFALPVVFLLCFTIAIASGLVRWHRHLIKDDPPESAQPWLQRSEWQFLWRWIWLGLMFVLLGVLALLVGGCIAVFVMGPESILGMLDPNSPAISLILFAGILFWIFLLAMGLTGWFFPRTFVSLAAVAVGEGQEYRALAKQIITRSDCSALALAILATTAPFLLFGIGLSLMMELAALGTLLPELSTLYIAVAVLDHIFHFMAIIVFATMLSLFYREHVVFEAAVGQAASAP